MAGEKLIGFATKQLGRLYRVEQELDDRALARTLKAEGGVNLSVVDVSPVGSGEVNVNVEEVKPIGEGHEVACRLALEVEVRALEKIFKFATGESLFEGEGNK